MCLAIPGKIISIHGEDPMTKIAKVDFGGVVKEVRLAYVPEAKVGDYVNVHIGFALSIIDEGEAREQLDILNEMYKASRPAKR